MEASNRYVFHRTVVFTRCADIVIGWRKAFAELVINRSVTTNFSIVMLTMERTCTRSVWRSRYHFHFHKLLERRGGVGGLLLSFLLSCLPVFLSSSGPLQFEQHHRDALELITDNHESEHAINYKDGENEWPPGISWFTSYR